MLKKFLGLSLVFPVLMLVSCKDEVLPKPTGQLSLSYPASEYKTFDKNCPFSFELNTSAVVKDKGNCNLELNYPKMKATIYLSYKSVRGDVNVLLRDAQKLTYEHVIKADDITEQPFVNGKDKVYGMFYQVNGNAATNAQFYVTDSIKHFVDCSVYFYAKPNFDSVFPAVDYMKNDMRRLMESLKWKK